MPGPLAGCRVIDVSGFMAGPFATMLLAEQGADVIKVEPISGDTLRRVGSSGHRRVTAMFMNTNRGKRSIAVDLKDPRGAGVVDRLLEGADVFLENFRAGIAERLGLGYDRLAARNPRLIYVSVNGVGNKGPMVGRRIYDTVIQGHAGICKLQGDDSPQLMRTLLGDKVAPTMVAQAITAALYERSQSGRGQRLDVSMLHALIWWMWADMMNFCTFADAERNEPPLYRDPPIYATSDGHLIILSPGDGDWASLCRAMEREDLVTDERFATIEVRRRHRAEMEAAIASEMSKRTTAEWIGRLTAADAAFGCINSPRDLLTDAQVLANGVFEVVQDEHFGPIRQPTHPAQFSRTPASAPIAPRLGQHTDEILESAGYSADERQSLRESGVVR